MIKLPYTKKRVAGAIFVFGNSEIGTSYVKSFVKIHDNDWEQHETTSLSAELGK